MGNFRSAQNTFLGGVLGESAYGRTELDAYKSGAKEMVNMIPSLAGSAQRIPPSSLIVPTDLLANATYSPFIRIHARFDNGYIISLRKADFSRSDVYWTNGTTSIQVAAYNPVTPAPHLMNNAYTSANGGPQFYDIVPIVIGDVLLLYSNKAPPHLLVKTPTEYALLPWDLVPWYSAKYGILNAPPLFATYPYTAQSTSGATLKVLTSKTVIEGKSKGILVNSVMTYEGIFVESESYYQGKFIKFNTANNTTIFYIKGKISATQLSVEYVLGTAVVDNTTDDFSFSRYGCYVYPNTATVHEERLVVSGNLPTPVIAFSRSKNLFTFMQDRLLQSTDKTADAANGKTFLWGNIQVDWPVVVALLTNTYSSTNFVCSNVQEVFVGTNEGLFSVSGNEGNAIAYNSISSRKITNASCLPVYPVVAEGSLFFASSDGELLYTTYINEGGGNKVIYATALYRPYRAITGLAYDDNLDAIFVSGTQDSSSVQEVGVIKFSLTTGSLSWAMYNIGDYTDRDTQFEIFRVPRNGNRMFAGVNGVGYVGGYQGIAELSTTINTNINAEMLVSKSADFGVISRLLFFEGKTVYVYSRATSGTDPYTVKYTYLHSGVVVGGSITVPSLVAEPEEFNLTVALPSYQILETLPAIDGGDAGSADMARKRIDRVFVRVRNAYSSVMIGPSTQYMTPLFGMEKAEPYNGIVEVSFLSGQTDDATVRIENRGPYSVEVTSLAMRGVTFD